MLQIPWFSLTQKKHLITFALLYLSCYGSFNFANIHWLTPNLTWGFYKLELWIGVQFLNLKTRWLVGKKGDLVYFKLTQLASNSLRFLLGKWSGWRRNECKIWYKEWHWSPGPNCRPYGSQLLLMCFKQKVLPIERFQPSLLMTSTSLEFSAYS